MQRISLVSTIPSPKNEEAHQKISEVQKENHGENSALVSKTSLPDTKISIADAMEIIPPSGPKILAPHTDNLIAKAIGDIEKIDRDLRKEYPNPSGQAIFTTE